jgi:O-antigen ligase
LPSAARQRVLDRLVPLLVCATVVGFAMGSSSVPDVTRVGHSLRWALLALLFVSAALWSGTRARLSGVAIAAAALAALAVLSAAWSVEPRTSFERAASLVLLFATCALIAEGVRGRSDRAERVLDGLLAGGAVVGLAGLVLLAAAHGRAVQSATYEAPPRFKGLGQDPNTVGLLFAVVVPLAVWALFRPGRRIAAVAALVLFAGTIVASGSRGALLAAGVGACVVVLARSGLSRVALAGVLATVVLVGAGIVVQAIPKPTATSASSSAPAPAGPTPKSGYLNAEARYPLSADVGQPLPGGGQPPVRRSFFGTSGRVDAWRGALHEAARRPVAGHGFGTEQAVFVDRYYRFVGGLPENSYIGLALQLGAAGLVALAALVAALGLAGRRALLRPNRALAAGALGVLAAGLVVALVQSYFYSVGNIAAAALWIPAFLLGPLADG